MSWGATIATGFIGGLLGGAGMFALGNIWVKWYRISSFEGKAGFFVIGMAFLGLVGGAVLALIAARIAASSASAAWTTQLAAGAGCVLAVLIMSLAISYLGADLEEDLGGRGVSIAWEVRLPKDDVGEIHPRAVQGGDPATWPDEELRLQLVAVIGKSPTGSEQAEFDRTAFRRENGQWILIARTPLFTSKGALCVNLKLGDLTDGFWPPISPRTPNVVAPGRDGTSPWSAWMRTNVGRKQASDEGAVMYRFRCEKQETKAD